MSNHIPPELDLTKPVQTRDGRAARILCTDLKATEEDQMLAVAITMSDGTEYVTLRSLSGECALSLGSLPEGDLINIPLTEVSYVNMYRQKGANGCIGPLRDHSGIESRDEADSYARSFLRREPNYVRVGCQKVTLEEGRWDD